MSTLVVQGLGGPHLLLQGYGPSAAGGHPTTARYIFRAAGGAGGPALPVAPTPRTPVLRSHERAIGVQVDMAADAPAADVVSSAVITVWAQPEQYEPVVPTDVTATLLVGQTQSGSTVTVWLDQANAVPRTEYTVVVVAAMASGETAQETIGPFICDA